MRVATYSDFALRLLMYAAIRHPNFVTINEVAAAYGISKNHLMKVTHELAQAGYLETVRGRGGGLRLAHPAKRINIGAVMRLTEKNSALVECFDPATNTCVITPACKLRHVLNDALQAFFKSLDRVTLADLVSEPRAIDRLFLPVA
jgi:Rrf2 family transcriptional regulator, nitric oxide-sensitive transcriptional repressor